MAFCFESIYFAMGNDERRHGTAHTRRGKGIVSSVLVIRLLILLAGRTHTFHIPHLHEMEVALSYNIYTPSNKVMCCINEAIAQWITNQNQSRQSSGTISNLLVESKNKRRHRSQPNAKRWNLSHSLTRWTNNEMYTNAHNNKQCKKVKCHRPN